MSDTTDASGTHRGGSPARGGPAHAVFRSSTVKCDGETLSCAAAVPSTVRRDSSPPLTAVVLHGAGTSDKTRLTGLMADFAARGHQALAFDFSGHGDSSGHLGELSLRRRFLQARAVIDNHISSEGNLVLIGFSMSGQTVADLVAHYGSRVAAIGLCAPAVYAAEAWSVPFGAGFTEIIRTPDSWRRSRALDVFRSLSPRAVLAVPGTDAVIPPAVTEAVADALGTSRSRFTRLVHPAADHRLGSWFADNAAPRGRFVDTVLRGTPYETGPPPPLHRAGLS
ncbi:alpha/beta hydrolase [Streptomyces sp. NPDC053427]|uniref:alpha/beta hydrolase n=1 Tax=Streptomyces sp. NPDC053427 TaxID=3365701 RepID=UPI0037D4BCEF